MPRATAHCCSTRPIGSLPSVRGSRSMDDIAAAQESARAGFRRFGSRAGLMLVLLDEDERPDQEPFLLARRRSGPTPAAGALVASAVRGCASPTPIAHCCRRPTGMQSRFGAPAMLQHTHVRLLLETAGSTGDLDAQSDALLALLDADYVASPTQRPGRDAGVPG